MNPASPRHSASCSLVCRFKRANIGLAPNNPCAVHRLCSHVVALDHRNGRRSPRQKRSQLARMGQILRTLPPPKPAWNPSRRRRLWNPPPPRSPSSCARTCFWNLALTTGDITRLLPKRKLDAWRANTPSGTGRTCLPTRSRACGTASTTSCAVRACRSWARTSYGGGCPSASGMSSSGQVRRSRHTLLLPTRLPARLPADPTTVNKNCMPKRGSAAVSAASAYHHMPNSRPFDPIRDF